MITPKILRKQLSADLIGKDAYRGVTLSYAWLANQFGHFSLGLVPALLLYTLLSNTSYQLSPHMAAAIIAITWLLFETYNFLGPLLLNKQSSSKRIFLPANTYVFQPAWNNLLFDTLTDILFFWIGACTAAIILRPSSFLWLLLLALLLLAIYPCYWWYSTKVRIQYARLPFQGRLGQWKGNISPENKQLVKQYIGRAYTSPANHLLIAGEPNTGKSTLCVAIATEMAFKGYTCSYYTATKLYHLLAYSHEEIIKMEGCDSWSWRTADLLIIDDIDPACTVLPAIITPETLLQLIDVPVKDQQPAYNRTILSAKNIIWVLGSPALWEHKDCYKNMLITLGVPETSIQTICLEPNGC